MAKEEMTKGQEMGTEPQDDQDEAEPELQQATHFLYALEDSGSLYGPPTVDNPLRLTPSTLYPVSMTTPDFLKRLEQDGVVTPVVLTPEGPIPARA